MALVQVRRRDAGLAALQALVLTVALLDLDRPAPVRLAPPPTAAPPATVAPVTPASRPPDVPVVAPLPAPRERVLCRTTVSGPRTGEAGYVVRGCVADEDGRPEAARIAVAHDVGFFEIFSRALVVTFSFGTACFVDHDCLGTDHPSVGAATNDAGQFRIVLPATADAGKTGHDRVFVQLGGGRAVAETRFKIRQAGTGDTVLEPFVAWSPHYVLGPRSVAFTPLRGDGQAYTLEVDSDRGGPFVVPVRSGDRIDPHLFPPGRSSVALRTGLGHATYRAAPAVRVVRERPWPASSGCSVTDRRGRATAVRGCGLTDGVWDTAALDAPTICGDRFASDDCLSRGWWVVTDLGRLRPVRDVVLAGGCSSPRTQVSADGRVWRAWGALGPTGSSLVSAPRPAPVQVRFVRTGCDDLTALGEVSAFG